MTHMSHKLWVIVYDSYTPNTRNRGQFKNPAISGTLYTLRIRSNSMWRGRQRCQGSLINSHYFLDRTGTLGCHFWCLLQESSTTLLSWYRSGIHRPYLSPFLVIPFRSMKFWLRCYFGLLFNRLSRILVRTWRKYCTRSLV